MKIRRWKEARIIKSAERGGEGRGDGCSERGLKRSTSNLLGKGNKSRVRWKKREWKVFYTRGCRGVKLTGMK